MPHPPSLLERVGERPIILTAPAENAGAFYLKLTLPESIGETRCWQENLSFLYEQIYVLPCMIYTFLYLSIMTTIVIDRKKYVLMPQKEYEALQMRAALKTKPEKKMSLAAGKKHAYKLIDKWAKGK